MSKSSTATEQLNGIKFHSTLQLKSGQISDVTKILRKEQIIKKKIKSVLDINALFQKEIKAHESEIKEERANITFQLGDLNKQMFAKLDYFNEQKLEKTKFKTNEIAHKSIQSMMQKYQKIDKECAMLRRIFQSIEQIHNNYESHSNQMTELVLNMEKSNKDYQEEMDTKLNDINEEIKAKILWNQKIDNHTQEMVREIDMFTEGLGTLKDQQQNVRKNIQRLKKMACKQQEKVNEIQQWSEIIIDKSSRKIVHKTLQSKQQYFQQLKTQNNQLQIYLFQLQNENDFLLQDQAKQSRRFKEIDNKSTVATKSEKTKRTRGKP